MLDYKLTVLKDTVKWPSTDWVCSGNFTNCGRDSVSVWITCRRFPHVFTVGRGHPWRTSKMCTYVKEHTKVIQCPPRMFAKMGYFYSLYLQFGADLIYGCPPLEKNKEAAQEGDRWKRERRLNFTAHLVVRAQKIAFLSPQLNMRAAETGRSLNNALQMERHSNKYI